jgi:hypothetical protein
MSTLYHKPGPPGSVLLATPAYGGVEAGYAFALFETGKQLEQIGITTELAIQAWDCHVDDARNKLVSVFLAGDCTDLVFLDSDLRWKPRDLVKLLSFDRDVVGSAYPLKQDRTEYSVEFLPETQELWSDVDGLIEVQALPTGFLRIRRNVLEAMAAAAPNYAAKGDDKPTTPLIFERGIDDGRRVSGDIHFCRKARAQGFKVHLLPDPGFEHIGAKTWRGSLAFHLRSAEAGPLKTAIDAVRSGQADGDLFDRLHETWGNPYAATGDLLAACVLLAREAKGPILEYGSGLSTLVMAAANPDVHLYAIENDLVWVQKLNEHASELGLTNITILPSDVVDGWYTTEAPDQPYALCLVDGPSRRLGGRQKAQVGDAAIYLFDDIGDPGVKSAAERIAADKGLKLTRLNVGHPRAFAVLSKLKLRAVA